MSSSIIMIQPLNTRMLAHSSDTVAYNFFHCLICCAKSRCNSSSNLLSRNEEKTVLFDFLCTVLNVDLPTEYSWDFVQEQNFPLCLRCTCVIKDMFQTQPAEDSIRYDMDKKVEKIKQTIIDSVQNRKLNTTSSIEDDRCVYFRNQALKKNFEKLTTPSLIANSKILVESNSANEISKERASTSKDVCPIAKRKRKRKVTKKKVVDDIIRSSENNARTPSSQDTCHIQFHTPLNSEDLAKIVSTILPGNYSSLNNSRDSNSNRDCDSIINSSIDFNKDSTDNKTCSNDVNEEMSCEGSSADQYISDDLYFPESPWSNWDWDCYEDWENITLPTEELCEIYEGEQDDELFQTLASDNYSEEFAIADLLDPDLFSTSLITDDESSDSSEHSKEHPAISDGSKEHPDISDGSKEHPDILDASKDHSDCSEDSKELIQLLKTCSDISKGQPECLDISEEQPDISDISNEQQDISEEQPHVSDISKEQPNISDISKEQPDISEISKEQFDCSNTSKGRFDCPDTPKENSVSQKSESRERDETRNDLRHSQKVASKAKAKKVEVITLEDDDDIEKLQCDSDDSCTIIEMNNNSKKGAKAPLKNVKTKTSSSSGKSKSDGKVHIVLTTHSYIKDPIYPDGSTNIVIEQKTPIEVKGGIFMAVQGAIDTWQCILCGKVVKNFKNHKSVHFPGQFKCSLCQAVFRRKDNLNAHLRSKH